MTALVDTADLKPTTPTTRFILEWSALGLRFLLMSVILTLITGVVKTRHNWKAVVDGASEQSISPLGAALNLGAFAAFAYLSLQVFNTHASAAQSETLILPCVFSGLLMIASTALVFVPLEMWRRFFRAARLAPVYGFGMSLTILGLSDISKSLWVPWMRLTYQVVAAGLHVIRGNVVADPANFTVGTSNFSVVIASGCSGYEGVALMLVFGSVWLWFFRREFRFPQAFLLLPVGAAAIWVLNCARIIALILIGDAGAPAVAAGGFHSEAGWISFVALAALVSVVSLRVPWIAVTEPRSATDVPLPLRSNQTAAYLLPFLAILAAGMAARAASASFEWLYPMRVLAAGAMLWFFRRNYSGLNWRIGWQSAAAGGLVFAVWIAAAGVTPRRARYAAGTRGRLRVGAICLAGVPGRGCRRDGSHRRGTGVPRLCPAPPAVRGVHVGGPAKIPARSAGDFILAVWPAARAPVDCRDHRRGALCRGGQAAGQHRRCRRGARGHQRPAGGVGSVHGRLEALVAARITGAELPGWSFSRSTGRSCRSTFAA